MKFLILNSPGKIAAFAVVVVVLATSIIWFTNHSMESDGMPIIEASIDKQLNDCFVQSPNLKGVSIGNKTRRHTVTHHDLSVTGFFEYDAQKNGSPMQLRVDWTKDSTVCQITRIESLNSDSAPIVLWVRH